MQFKPWMKTTTTCFLITLCWQVAAGPQQKQQQALAVLLADEQVHHGQGNYCIGPASTAKPPVRRFKDISPKAQARKVQISKEFLARLHNIDYQLLDEDDQLNYDVFQFYLKCKLTFGRYKTWRRPFFSDSGFHTYLTNAWRRERLQFADDFQAYLDKLADLPRYFDQQIANMQLGLDENFISPKPVLDGLLPSFSAYFVQDAKESAFYQPFKHMPKRIEAKKQRFFQREAQQVIMAKVMPAYRKLAAFMQNTYYPKAPTTLGASEFPDGKAYYQAMVAYYTTLDLTAEQVHQIGLKEVKRIRTAMQAVITELKFKGSFADFLHFLRTDPQFYASSADQLLMHASALAKKIDAKMPAYFNKLPRQPYGVEAVPAAIAPNYTTGRYIGAPLDGKRAGTYWVNTFALNKRPLYVLPALTLHEAVPGHHHQNALSKELENVPLFRQSLQVHAFGEGWGLYSEKLGEEMGLYRTPYQRFGRLTYEMWRAARLVIDTGIHAKGWSRDRAITFLSENSALSSHNIKTEIDRYISWPGQALAYKMGELKIIELRNKAEQQLGHKFDLRDFHDQVLSAGAIPLRILQTRIDKWITHVLQ